MATANIVTVMLRPAVNGIVAQSNIVPSQRVAYAQSPTGRTIIYATRRELRQLHHALYEVKHQASLRGEGAVRRACRDAMNDIEAVLNPVSRRPAR